MASYSLSFHTMTRLCHLKGMRIPHLPTPDCRDILPLVTAKPAAGLGLAPLLPCALQSELVSLTLEPWAAVTAERRPILRLRAEGVWETLPPHCSEISGKGSLVWPPFPWSSMISVSLWAKIPSIVTLRKGEEFLCAKS